MQIEYRLPTVTEYKRLRDLAGWWETDENATGLALKNSLFSVVAVEDDMVIGVGRIIGDGGLYFYLQDLIIDPKFQKKGLGKTLVKGLMGYITAHAKPGAFIGLTAAKGLKGYYERFGFKACEPDAPGMFQVIK